MDQALRTQSFAETYERVLVPSIFGPWASELIDRTRPIGPAERILDLGCGTGIVARLLRERLGGGARISGLDANADLLAMARKLAPELDWHEGNAMKLPFGDASFELVVSQQMLQFVPDRAAAVRDVRRVLVPGGRFVVATWRARHEQPLFEKLGRIAEHHLGTPNEKRFSLGNDAELRSLLEGAGFRDVRVEIVTRAEFYREFPFRLSACAANFDLSRFSADECEAKLSAVEADSIEASKEFAVDGGLAAPARANIVTAVAA